MSALAPTAPGWLPAARALAQRPAAAARLPFAVAGRIVGSVAEGVLDEIIAMPPENMPVMLSKREHYGVAGWHLDSAAGDASAALALLADALRRAGRCGPWRDEQLAVCSAAGERIGTVERGAVRVLGIATRAVHLVAIAPDGRMWVQQRAFDKPTHPGRWDTLMGGMVSAADTLDTALERETWEEAGLRIAALQDVVHGGHVDFARPSDDGEGAGYMVERIDWFHATVPEGLAPENQDGEVERFELLAAAQVHARLARCDFTPEAALVLAGFYWPQK
ncbi:NUDIX domain-containing protein [Acidovorax sp. SUPP3334]|uniref:NUDIX hydrolase n=1 Tax=Acidovorax sp. SUPP3334 TaxID=2920881 RepID=UPI0023DE37EC|nr:NUDIX domain-containing protein [Acidovorax sp. SUPP3334]GKT24058.1 NUDIX domain-containing protein [Acidovorax sp. SUPP3334]